MLTPEILMTNETVRDMLFPFDFTVVSNEEYGPVWFETAPLAPFEIVAQRSSGCVYALIGPQRHVLLATTEGEAGIVAANLKECLELVIAHPYWQDVVCRSRGEVETMRQILRDGIEDFEADALGDNPEIEPFRPLLREQLGLAVPNDPAGRLHHALAVLDADVMVRGDDGWLSAPLISRYKWR